MIVVACFVLYDFVVWCYFGLCVVRCVWFVVVVVRGVCLVCVLFVLLRCVFLLFSFFVVVCSLFVVCVLSVVC